MSLTPSKYSPYMTKREQRQTMITPTAFIFTYMLEISIILAVWSVTCACAVWALITFYLVTAWPLFDILESVRPTAADSRVLGP